MHMTKLKLYARYLCSRDALGLKASRPSSVRDDRISCIQMTKKLYSGGKNGFVYVTGYWLVK